MNVVRSLLTFCLNFMILKWTTLRNCFAAMLSLEYLIHQALFGERWNMLLLILIQFIEIHSFSVILVVFAELLDEEWRVVVRRPPLGDLLVRPRALSENCESPGISLSIDYWSVFCVDVKVQSTKSSRSCFVKPFTVQCYLLTFVTTRWGMTSLLLIVCPSSHCP